MRRFLPSFHTGVVIVAAVFAVLASAAVAFQAPPLNSGDEPAHLDYVIDVWHGTLPSFEAGLTIRPPFGPIPPVQWVAQHPPLFYWLLAPFVGPLWDGGHLYFAVLAGRSVNAVLAGATVLACAWGARRIAPGRPEVASVTAVVISLTSMLLLVGGAVYNDLPNVAFGALALGVAATAIRRGLGTPLVVGAALVTTGGMLSRLTFAVFVVAVVAAFVCALGFRRGQGFWNGPVGRAVAVVVVLALPALASGWFYLRNVATSGNVAGSHPEWSQEHMHRVTATFPDTVTSPGFWRGVFSVFRGHEPLTAYGWTWPVLLVPLVLGLVVLVVGPLRRNRLFPLPAARTTGRRSRGEGDAPGVLAEPLVVLMLLAVFVLLVVLQVFFVMQGGAPQTRYGLPMMPILAVVMAYGLTSWGRFLSPVLVTAWVAAAGWIWFRILQLAVPPYLSAVPLQIARVATVAAVVVIVVAVALFWWGALRRRGDGGADRMAPTPEVADDPTLAVGTAAVGEQR